MDLSVELTTDGETGMADTEAQFRHQELHARNPPGTDIHLATPLVSNTT